VKMILVNNEKGGARKSTIAVHLAWYFAEHRKRVLFLDLDPQSNGTTTLGVRNLAALIAGHFVLAPIDLDDCAIDGIETLLKQILGVSQKYNPNLTFLGLIPNRLQTTSPRQRDNLKNLVQKFGTKYLFDGVIPQRSSIERRRKRSGACRRRPPARPVESCGWSLTNSRPKWSSHELCTKTRRCRSAP